MHTYAIEVLQKTLLQDMEICRRRLATFANPLPSLMPGKLGWDKAPIPI